MANARSNPHPQPAVLRTLGQDAGRLWTEIWQHGPKRTIGRTLLDLQEFYVDAGGQERLRGMRSVRRVIYLVGFLLKSLFLKLTPARRVLLLLSMVFIWQATFVERRGPFAESGSHFPVLGVAMLLLILMLELKDKLTAREELEAGRAVQRALMPAGNPAIPGWDVWLFTRSANDVGGDLVDAVPVADGRFGLALGDVAGKGLPAALLMAKLQSTLRALASGEPSLAVLGEKTNRILCRDGLPNRFATLVYLEVAAGAGSVRLLNAGHPPPLILRGPRLEELPLGSMALGMLPDATFTEREVALANGDVLIAFSDGLTEAMNERDEFFGDERLRARLPALAGMTAENVGTQVVAAVDAFVGDTRPHDDLSLVVLRRAG